MAFGLTVADSIEFDSEREPVVISGQLESSVTNNNQLRTGADKGNPTV